MDYAGAITAVVFHDIMTINDNINDDITHFTRVLSKSIRQNVHSLKLNPTVHICCMFFDIDSSNQRRGTPGSSLPGQNSVLYRSPRRPRAEEWW